MTNATISATQGSSTAGASNATSLAQFFQQETATVVASAAVTTSTSSSSSGQLLSTQSPTLASIASGAQPSADFQNTILQYMEQVILAAIQLISDHSKVSQVQTNAVKASVQSTQSQLTTASQNLATLLQQIKAQQSDSFWSELIGIVACVVLVIVAFVTEQPELVFLAGVMLMMTTVGNQLLESALKSLSPW